MDAPCSGGTVRLGCRSVDDPDLIIHREKNVKISTGLWGTYLMSNTYDSAANSRLLRMAVEIVSAYVTAHALPNDALPGLIREVYQTLSALRNAPEVASGPAVPLRRSVFNDHLICLEDGLSMKMLKRHLLTVHQLTPGEYRAKWGLPPDYPMVAPDYAKVRSALAKQSGLGRKPEDRPRRDRPAAEGRGERRKRAAPGSPRSADRS
jgi:predicted transcriptional regulator